MTLRTIFAGTPDFAVPSLEHLIADPRLDVVAVFAQPDRPAGRGRKLSAGPVKASAERHGIKVLQPASMKTSAAIELWRGLTPDLAVVAAYGMILPLDVITAARLATINVHASLLPRWRGAAPIQRAIMAGDDCTGISIMRIVEQLDAGPVWLQRSIPITADDTGGSVHDQLAALGGECLDQAVESLSADRVSEQPQDEAAVTFAPKLTRGDREIDWSRSATELDRRIRALSPLPGCVTNLAGVEVKLLLSAVIDSEPAPPGTIIGAGSDGIDIATGAGAIRIRRLQAAGKRPVTAAEFLNGYGAAIAAGVAGR